MRHKRKKIWIDRFQTTLSGRLALYFLLYQIAVFSLFWIDARLVTLGDSFGMVASTFGFVLTPLASITLGLLFIYDAVKTSHKFVGPLYRFRKTIEAVTAGEEVEIVRLRADDQLQEFKDELNAMLRALERRGAITLKASGTEKQLTAV